MGQYYRPVLQNAEGEITVLNRKVDGKRTLAKLMEHSWWDNEFVGTVTRMLYDEPAKIAWVGDYADEYGDLGKALYSIAWAEGEDGVGVSKDVLLLDGKVILNHTKKLYLCCNEYKKKSVDKEGWVLHPIPMLTAIGNGGGGGDYHHGANQDFVGCWAFDEIEVDDITPEGYDKLDVWFKEERA